ncbi:MAG: YfiR family protein [Cyclobacteriaceae bacterium]
MQKIISSITLLLILLVSANGTTNHQRKAGLVYYIMKNVEWPSDKPVNSDYIITVIGSAEMKAELERVTADKKIANKPIKVVRASKAEDVQNSHIVYLTDDYSNQFLKARFIANSFGALLFTESEGFAARGSSINLVTDQGRIAFEINNKSISAVNVKLSSRIKEMAY